MKRLREIYRDLFDREAACELAEWQIAKAILENFNVPKIGEDEAREALLLIINYVKFPSLETTIKIIGWAEAKATELWPELPEEPHMALFEWIKQGGLNE